MMLKRLLPVVVSALLLMLPAAASAQIAVPHTIADGETIDAARLNTNFSTIGGDACNRTGCTMTGTLTARNIAVVAHDTYDLATTGTRFRALYLSAAMTSATVEVESTAADSIDTAGGIEAGSGNVQIINTAGKIPALSSTYFASLDGTNLTGLAKTGSTNTFTAVNTFSSRVDLTNYAEKGPSASISSGTLTLDLSTATHFEVALNANITTLAVTNVPNPTDGVVAFTIHFTADGTVRTVDWADINVKWPGGVAPTMTGTNGRIDVITLISYNAGTSWLGFIGGQNFQ